MIYLSVAELPIRIVMETESSDLCQDIQQCDASQYAFCCCQAIVSIVVTKY